MRLKPLALLLVLTTLATTTEAQRRQRPPRDGQTPTTVAESIRSADEKKAARTLELQTGWDGAKDHHFTKQDRATRKRMKRTAKKSQRYRSGRHVPWWKRIFGRRQRLR
jgi:hypothetical protein